MLLVLSYTYCDSLYFPLLLPNNSCDLTILQRTTRLETTVKPLSHLSLSQLITRVRAGGTGFTLHFSDFVNTLAS